VTEKKEEITEALDSEKDSTASNDDNTSSQNTEKEDDS